VIREITIAARIGGGDPNPILVCAPRYCGQEREHAKRKYRANIMRGTGQSKVNSTKK
jgi:hypothetical protein